MYAILIQRNKDNTFGEGISFIKDKEGNIKKYLTKKNALKAQQKLFDNQNITTINYKVVNIKELNK